MTLTVQFMTMAAMVVSGLYLGMSLDTFRRFTPYFKKSAFLTYSLEISFWLMQAFILFFILFRVNGGELRVYIILAVLLGFSLYQALLKRLYLFLLEKIIQLIIAVYRFFTRLVQLFLIAPIRWTFIAAMKFLLVVGTLLLTILHFIVKVILFPFQLIGKLVFRLLPSSVKNILFKWAGFYSKIKNKCIQLLKRR